MTVRQAPGTLHALVLPVACAVVGAGSSPAGTYRLLRGYLPAEADITHDDAFDHHVLASILAAAAVEGRNLAEQSGLAPEDLAMLVVDKFPHLTSWSGPRDKSATAPDDDEVVMVRDLLRMNRSTDGKISWWLAAMVARRAVEPNHLWEDLGLRDRAELSRLLMRHFHPLAVRNSRNMRWKRFFYRMLCEDDGFVMCTTPVCTQCNDFDLCFGEENGESRMAERRRDHLLQRPPAVMSQG